MTTLKDLNLFSDKCFGLYVNGEWIQRTDKGTFYITNPSTKEILVELPKGGTKETQAAIESAEKAFLCWSQLTAKERGSYLIKLHYLMIEYRDELAKIISMEMGKAITEAKGEVTYAASFLTWYAEEGRRVYGETIPPSKSNKRIFIIKQPIGVVAAITPWNFPLSMLTRKIAPALAAGCTSIIKPASQTSLTAIAFAKLVEKAGFPEGVINIVAGSTKEISDEIFNNPVVKKVSFTGSTEVGKDLVVRSAKQLKRLSLELGGHAPFIVFEDANVEKAVEGIIASKFRNAGQACICANRVFVHKNIKEEFTKAFIQKVNKLKVGNSMDETVDIGPLVNEEGLKKVIEHVEDAVDKGAIILCGGQRPVANKGFFYEPTILDNISEDMKIMTEETFGPVVPLSTFEKDEKVIHLANSTHYGLAAYIYTNTINRAVTVAESLDFGVIGLNDAMPVTEEAPFGGLKESGYGKEGGHHGMREYIEEKYISLEM